MMQHTYEYTGYRHEDARNAPGKPVNFMEYQIQTNMKTSILCCLLAFAFTVSAQPLTESPARIYIKQYNNLIEKAKLPDTKPGMVRTYLQQAETALKSIAKYDPSYNVSQMEAELNRLKAANAGDQANAKVAKITGKLEELFTEMDKVEEAMVLGQYPHRITRAEAALAELKKTDPAYATEALETRLQRYKDHYAKIDKDRHDQMQANNASMDKDGDGVAGLFAGDKTTGITFTGNLEADLARHKEELKVYNEKVDKLIASGSLNADKFIDYMRNQVPTEKEKITKLEKDISEATSTGGLGAYSELKGVEVYWNAARRVFTTLPEAVTVHQLALSALQRLGTEEQVKAKIAVNYNALVRRRVFPAAVQKNASLEQHFRNVFSAQIPGEQIVKVNIITPDWTTVRHSVTGILLARKQAAAIGVKTKQGICKFYIYQIKQDYIGNSFGSFVEYSRGDQGEIFCDNIK